MDLAIQRIQRDIYNNYVKDVGLAPAEYFGGARLRPVIPLDTAVGGIFILGAYPSARFEVVEDKGGVPVSDVPVGDNMGPFEPERYFDGRRVRTQASADELAEFYLKPLGVSRAQCWVTDLVKVFLFKDRHRAKYERLGAKPPTGYVRESFENLGTKSRCWIDREVAVARPKLVITLGAEVAGIIRGKNSPRARVQLLGGEPSAVNYGGLEVLTVHLAHPGIVMRKGSEDSKNKWPRVHAEQHIPQLRLILPGLLARP